MRACVRVCVRAGGRARVRAGDLLQDFLKMVEGVGRVHLELGDQTVDLVEDQAHLPILFFGNFSGHADGERRGLDRISAPFPMLPSDSI